MYLKFARNVAPVCYHRVCRNAEVVGYFLVGHSLYKAYYDVLLPVAQGFAIVVVAAYHLRYFRAHVVLFVLLLELSYGRNEYAFFYERVVFEPFLVVVKFIERRRKLVVAPDIAWQVFYDDVFKFLQFQVCLVYNTLG